MLTKSLNEIKKEAKKQFLIQYAEKYRKFNNATRYHVEKYFELDDLLIEELDKVLTDENLHKYMIQNPLDNEMKIAFDNQLYDIALYQYLELLFGINDGADFSLYMNILMIDNFGETIVKEKDNIEFLREFAPKVDEEVDNIINYGTINFVFEKLHINTAKSIDNQNQITDFNFVIKKANLKSKSKFWDYKKQIEELGFTMIFEDRKLFLSWSNELPGFELERELTDEEKQLQDEGIPSYLMDL